jgi:membrane-associated protease RseP (regulator of RpoE activity)
VASARADEPAAKPAVPAKPVVVPFELLKTMHMTVPIKVNGKGPYRVIFDTGAPVTLLSTKIGRETGLLAKNAPKPLLGMFGAVGQTNIKTLEVGGLKANDVSAVVMDHPTLQAIAQVLGPIEGIVGFPFFARYHMTLDYQTKTMTFVPNGFKPPDVIQSMMATMMSLSRKQAPERRVLAPWGLLGLEVEEAGDGAAGVRVTAVVAQGPAAKAGLRAGDRLLTLDGRWTDSVADCYTAAGKVQPETAVPVVVRRGGEEVTLTLRAAKGI